MNLIILGTSRCGKTMLANMISTRLIGYSKISIDNLKNAFKNVYPELDVGFSKNKGNAKFENFLEQYYESCIYKDNKNGSFYIIEGGGISEETIINLAHKQNTRVIFLGKASIDPNEYARQIRQYEFSYDYGGWTKRLSDDTLANWCADWVRKSNKYREFCNKQGFEFYDTSENQVEVLERIIYSLKWK